MLLTYKNNIYGYAKEYMALKKKVQKKGRFYDEGIIKWTFVVVILERRAVNDIIACVPTDTYDSRIPSLGRSQ